jgi:hypothetical protein
MSERGESLHVGGKTKSKGQNALNDVAIVSYKISRVNSFSRGPKDGLHRKKQYTSICHLFRVGVRN